MGDPGDYAGSTCGARLLLHLQHKRRSTSECAGRHQVSVEADIEEFHNHALVAF